ncbi:MAG: CDP-2,3-bis-(O-geranylgeranyl)-sn-glycerol synthase [Archaeoglobaceae archaeon]
MPIEFHNIDYMTIPYIILITIWLLLPSYAPNNFAVVFGGGRPIDLGRNFIDGARLLGDGKTIRGFIAGGVGGVLVAHVQLFIENLLDLSIYSSIAYASFLGIIMGLAFGALIGDMAGSFIKRRLKVERGGILPLLDQLDFLIIALLAASLSTDFFVLFTIPVIIAAFIMTPFLHTLTNLIAYKLGLKKVPW